ncbi:hypothetical protein TNIN_244891 [Trichonephila inaurata madagascariensis]|uniref:Uncharacterized protein n=1 Tax=Trichonephila inaurata madagascariensis TaxID=2747483 RepID=A0A8X6Y2R1_9ARAC|nr:hypothetical protein TNIN_244891 [Trichonephila inaurata madagascariensis]
MYPQKIPPDLEPGYYRAHNLKASAIAPEIWPPSPHTLIPVPFVAGAFVSERIRLLSDLKSHRKRSEKMVGLIEGLCRNLLFVVMLMLHVAGRAKTRRLIRALIRLKEDQMNRTGRGSTSGTDPIAAGASI